MNDLKELYQMNIEKGDITLSEFDDRDHNGSLLTPEYQRTYIYNTEQASKLIESVLLGIPIPSVYLCEENNLKLFIVDGQQRITSFLRFLNNKFKLTGLESYTSKDGKDINGSYFKDLEDDLQERIREFQLKCIIIKESSKEKQFEIFARLNLGAVKLTEQEIRNVLYRGSLINMFNNLVDEDKLKLFKKTFKKPNKGKSQQETLILFCSILNWNKNAFDINGFLEKNQNLDEESVNNLKNSIFHDLKTASDILGIDCFTFNSINFNKNLFLLIMLVFHLLDLKQMKEEDKKIISDLISNKLVLLEYRDSLESRRIKTSILRTQALNIAMEIEKRTKKRCCVKFSEEIYNWIKYFSFLKLCPGIKVTGRYRKDEILKSLQSFLLIYSEEKCDSSHLINGFSLKEVLKND